MSLEPEPPLFVCLIAPNVSEQMGGEGMMALQIYQELEARGVPIRQISHARVRDEISRKFPGMSISYIADTWLDRVLWKSKVLAPLLGLRYMSKAAKLAGRIAEDHPGTIIHYTSPVSPVTPQFLTPGVPTIIGPITGNIHHPPAFRNRESRGDRLRRVLLGPVQTLHRWLAPGKRKADVVLVAGGERTRQSLEMAGCRESQFKESLCCGIPERLRDEPLVEHHGRNLRFVQNGRLVPHKGTDLIIRSLARTKLPIELDVIGRGPEKLRLERLVAELNLQDRVRFIEWFPDHSQLYAALRSYRAFVFPSLAEAHGIVVQEAMMMGLPVVCADWGGPADLATPDCGILIKPTSEDTLITGLADAMDRLADDPELANRMARAGRSIAIERGFAWPDLIDRWIAIYHELAAHAVSTLTPATTAPSFAKGVE